MLWQQGWWPYAPGCDIIRFVQIFQAKRKRLSFDKRKRKIWCGKWILTGTKYQSIICPNKSLLLYCLPKGRPPLFLSLCTVYIWLLGKNRVHHRSSLRVFRFGCNIIGGPCLPAIHTGSTHRTEQEKKKKIWNTEEKRAAERKKSFAVGLCGLPCDVVISPETTIT